MTTLDLDGVALDAQIRTHFRATQFLNTEAALLDARQLRAWLALLSPDIVYHIPLRVTRETSQPDSDYTGESFLMLDDFSALETRVARFETEHAWVEVPSSRMRRFVSNVVVNSGDHPDEWKVSSNILLFRGRVDPKEDALLSGHREDVLSLSSDGGLLLRRRTVYLDHNIIPMRDFAIFL